MRPFSVIPLLLFAWFLFAEPGGVQAQTQESVPAVTRTPGGALWRAAVVPGWGQIYNKQYLKLPFVYGARGGLLVAAITINDDYQLYRKAFLYKAFEEHVEAGLAEINPYCDEVSYYNRLANELGANSSRPICAQRDTFRRNRDLSYLGIGLVYALSVLDAYVSAHLLDFNVDENLAFRITPAPSGVRLRARIVIP